MSPLLAILRDIHDTTPSMVNICITTDDGLRVVTLLPSSEDDDVSIARGAVALSLGTQLIKSAKLEQLQEVVISTIDYTYLIVPVTSEIFVEALLNDDTAISDTVSMIRQKSELIERIWNELNALYS